MGAGRLKTTFRRNYTPERMYVSSISQADGTIYDIKQLFYISHKNQKATHHPYSSPSGFDFFSSNRERGTISKKKIGVVLHRARERIASSSSSVVCSAFTAARPLPHCQRHAVEMGLISFFFFFLIPISLVYEKDCIFLFHRIFCLCFVQIVFCCS